MKLPAHRSPILLSLWVVFFLTVLVVWVRLTPPLRTMALNLRPLAFAAAFSFAWCGIGAPLVRIFARSLKVIDQVLLSFALGIGLTGLVVFGLGLFGVVEVLFYAIWTLLGLCLFVVAVIRWWRPLRFKVELSNPFNLLALFILVPTVLQVIPALTTPVVSTDAMEYHLSVPKLYLQAGIITHIPTIMEASYPSLAPYLYMPIMAMAGDVACKSMHFLVGMALLLAMGRLSSRIWPDGGRLLAPALFLSMPVAVNVVSMAWNDGFFVFFIVLALGLLLDYDESHDKPIALIALAGTLFGLAAWTKYTIVMILMATAPLLLYTILKRQWKVWHVVAFASPLGLISLLVFVKNWIFVGNPFHPFLHRLFFSPFWNDAADHHFHTTLRAWEIQEWNLTTYLTLPFHITLTPRLIDIHTGVVALVLIPFVFVRSQNRQATLLKIFVGCYLLSFLILHTENRSLLTMLAVFFCLAAGGLEHVLKDQGRIRIAAVLLIGISATLNIGMATVNSWYMTEPFRFFIGKENSQTFLLREAPSHETISWLNDNTAVNQVVLVGFKRPYYVNKPAYFSAFSDPPIIEVLTRGARSQEDVWRILTGLGITHVAVNWPEYRIDHKNALYSWPDEQHLAFEACMVNLAKRVHRNSSKQESVYLISQEPAQSAGP